MTANEMLTSVPRPNMEILSEPKFKLQI